MKKRLQQRERAIDAIAKAMLADGLSKTSLRQLAAAADVSDRMLLYYFEDKDDVIAAALGKITTDLAAELERITPANETAPAHALFEQAAKLTMGATLAPYMRISVELAAAAARNEEPFATLSAQIAKGFVTWTEQRLSGPSGPQRRALAAMIIAMIDGLAVLQASAGKATAEIAAREMASVLKAVRP
ncbi:MAG: TetR/AcrR family transcriptional regulator [Pseudomonadota bacterium]